MKARALEYIGQARKLWASLSTVKRVAFIVLTSAALVAAVSVSLLSTHVSYTYLFTDLNQEDAAAIVAKLDELKIPHRVTGTAIQVPEERVHEIRLQLAGAGLPRGGGVGFELFDKSNFGATEFEQQVNLRRALEGELARTISSIETVQSARVHLVMPERSVFALRNQAGSASVVLQLRPGRGFGHREVSAVVHLVSSAAPGLTPERVSVVSADGSVLHRPASDAKGAPTSRGLDEEDAERAASLEARVRELLERVVGPGHADVRVSLALEESARERTEERYDPKETAIRSEYELREGAGQDTPPAEGIPGARSNLPEGADPADYAEAGVDGAPDYADDVQDDNPSGFRRSLTRNYEVSRVTEKTTTPPGGIRRLSVAVLVDGVYETVDGVEKFRPRNAEELKQLSALVKGVVGFDTSRGDALQMESARFFVETPEPEPVPATPLLPAWLRWYHGAGAGALVGLLCVAALVALVRRARKKYSATALQLNGEPANPILLGDGAKAVPGLPPKDLGDPSRLREEAIELVLRDPDTASVILREWLNAGPTPRSAMLSGTSSASS